MSPDWGAKLLVHFGAGLQGDRGGRDSLTTTPPVGLCHLGGLHGSHLLGHGLLVALLLLTRIHARGVGVLQIGGEGHHDTSVKSWRQKLQAHRQAACQSSCPLALKGSCLRRAWARRGALKWGLPYRCPCNLTLGPSAIIHLTV